MATFDLLAERSSGVLLHPTSLPGRHGTGDLGPAARAFADWLAAAGQTWWQMLPIGVPGFGASPYDSASCLAGSPFLISLDDLVEDGLLRSDEIEPPPGWDPAVACHVESQGFREAKLRLAFERFRHGPQDALQRFRESAGSWLAEWSLFAALQRAHGGARWTDWPAELRERQPGALAEARRALAEQIAFREFEQLVFDRQWTRFRAHCQARGLRLMGDVPMFVAHDGADVWANQELFFLDQQGRSTVVAGVPPDAFSATGQLWGNPLYRWDRLEQSDFAWWLERLRVTLTRFDALRLDHFIGYRRYWEIPADSADARVGRFCQVPGEALFEAASRKLGGLPFVAEDLGILTPEVHALRDRFGLPGMRVLQFAFGDDQPNDYRPHRFVRHCLVYTGTHDNDTTVGWFASASEQERARVLRYFGISGTEIHWELMRAALGSVAALAIFPLQDVLGLGSAARMNTPATSVENWKWRARAGEIRPDLAERLRALCHEYERTPRPHPGDAQAFGRDPARLGG